VPWHWKIIRYSYRLPLLVLQLALHLPITLLLINRWTHKIQLSHPRLGHETLAERVTRIWQGSLMNIFGFRLQAFGTPHPGACLSVANHVSWLDITLIHSQRVVHFVAKSEISRWPLIGWMARKAGTIYHQRGSTDSLATVAAQMQQRLLDQHSIGVFPEGGSSTSFFVRTFHARIFQPAVESGAPVQPIALRYVRGEQLAHSVPFREEEGFLKNFFRLLAEPGGVAEVHFLPIIVSVQQPRRVLSEAARAAIAACVGAQDELRPEQLENARTSSESLA
jgi:1-acyl-sn-glycerol-3-phosphate acyltransferase